MQKNRLTKSNVGIVLGFLGGVASILESSFVLVYVFVVQHGGTVGLVGFGVAILATVGVIMV